MVQERERRGKGVYWTLRLWSVAVVSILLLSTCFIASCVVTYQLTMDNPNGRLSERHTNHSSISCWSEGIMVSDKVWSCCPMNWTPFGSNCYFISTDLTFWNESEENCSSMGAHLLVIHSPEEQNFITRILATRAGYFIGLRDPGHRQWRWVDGTPYNANVTFWHKDEPNNEEEQCVTLVYWTPVWGWNDLPCSYKQKSVCKMKKIYF
ncbi:C-type lectin domain family 6 member A-like isoform X2 [Meriones unguiculatus]|uniref:C-type lectin domain family 6 member A-like isoform X2 n=1 Tax=Meriones unguiculatus TaxID=10047 RepID=UPI000B4EA9E5|nr:C-type lectin domain family 6 member A-like isoform X2 [Meriones unguiculatus]